MTVYEPNNLLLVLTILHFITLCKKHAKEKGTPHKYEDLDGDIKWRRGKLQYISDLGRKERKGGKNACFKTCTERGKEFTKAHKMKTPPPHGVD